MGPAYVRLSRFQWNNVFCLITCEGCYCEGCYRREYFRKFQIFRKNTSD